MTKTFDELMGIIKYGSEQDKAVLLKALLIEKERRKHDNTKSPKPKEYIPNVEDGNV